MANNQLNWPPPSIYQTNMYICTTFHSEMLLQHRCYTQVQVITSYPGARAPLSSSQLRGRMSRHRLINNPQNSIIIKTNFFHTALARPGRVWMWGQVQGARWCSAERTPSDHLERRKHAGVSAPTRTQCRHLQGQLPWKRTFQSWLIHLLLLFGSEALHCFEGWKCLWWW